MEAIKNSDGKTICRAFAKDKFIEIKNKDIVTTIRFLDDGSRKKVHCKITFAGYLLMS